MDLEQVKQTFTKWLLLEDDTIIDVVMGVVVANILPGEPVNVYLVGPPSSGKTEVVRSTGSFPRVEEVSTLTAHSLISGWDRGNRVKHKPSLIMRMKDEGKILMVFKDFTSVLLLRTDLRQEVLLQMREIADGSFSKPFGTGVKVMWKGKIGFLAGVTGIIDDLYSAANILCERFLFYRIEDSINPLRQAEVA